MPVNSLLCLLQQASQMRFKLSEIFRKFLYIADLGLHCLICFVGQISNNSNYRKKFKYFVKFILMKIRTNLSKMEVYAQPVQNL
jgi:hypothetical protein